MTEDTPAAAAPIIGEWFHSHEEDAPGVTVYRPSSFEFPPARMARESITFRPSGEAAVGTAGPADRAELTPASWSVVGEEVVVDLGEHRTRRFTLELHDHAALLIAREQSEGPNHAHQDQG